MLSAGIGAGDEFSFCRWHECDSCCEAEEEVGIWDGDKVASVGNAHRGKGK